MTSKQYYMYILASEKYGSLYVGVTSNLIKCIDQHKNDDIQNFSKKYKVNKLVYYEIHQDIREAILQE